ncbi:hypothetical protein GALMADRAFT_213959 [Galerina marginata CBS 339.88]|uniref:Uncharacterized protein n=1 Tax=Galerina marginata (strain CBS 339.88) TaxID=685588 RepID=A0A067SJX7_GALM3|nr:hypothetical protein GALMADRAFT_213959 [Galerina marginata CBS 339.88]
MGRGGGAKLEVFWTWTWPIKSRRRRRRRRRNGGAGWLDEKMDEKFGCRCHAGQTSVKRHVERAGREAFPSVLRALSRNLHGDVGSCRHTRTVRRSCVASPPGGGLHRCRVREVEDDEKEKESSYQIVGSSLGGGGGSNRRAGKKRRLAFDATELDLPQGARQASWDLASPLQAQLQLSTRFFKASSFKLQAAGCTSTLVLVAEREQSKCMVWLHHHQLDYLNTDGNENIAE